MDDLIVIILTLIIVVAGAIGQIKKKKLPQPEPEGEQQNSSDNPWDILEDFETRSQKPITNIPVPKPEVTAEKPKEQYKYTFNAENEGQSPVEKKPSSIKDEIIQNTGKKEKEKISETFSLRKAVIYNEILNRKYT